MWTSTLLEGLISNPCIKEFWGKICNEKFLHYSLVSKFLLNRIVDHLETCGLFSDFQYGFRSSRSTVDLLIVVSDRITRAINSSGATRAVVLDTSKVFDRAWHASLLHKPKSMEFQVRYLALVFLFSIIDGFKGFGWKIFTIISS